MISATVEAQFRWSATGAEDFVFLESPANYETVPSTGAGALMGTTLVKGRRSAGGEWVPGAIVLELDNSDRRYDPSYAAGPQFENLLGKPLRVKLSYNGESAYWHGTTTKWTPHPTLPRIQCEAIGHMALFAPQARPFTSDEIQVYGRSSWWPLDEASGLTVADVLQGQTGTIEHHNDPVKEVHPGTTAGPVPEPPATVSPAVHPLGTGSTDDYLASSRDQALLFDEDSANVRLPVELVHRAGYGFFMILKMDARASIAADREIPIFSEGGGELNSEHGFEFGYEVEHDGEPGDFYLEWRYEDSAGVDTVKRETLGSSISSGEWLAIAVMVTQERIEVVTSQVTASFTPGFSSFSFDGDKALDRGCYLGRSYRAPVTLVDGDYNQFAGAISDLVIMETPPPYGWAASMVRYAESPGPWPGYVLSERVEAISQAYGLPTSVLESIGADSRVYARRGLVGSGSGLVRLQEVTRAERGRMFELGTKVWVVADDAASAPTTALPSSTINTFTDDEALVSSGAPYAGYLQAGLSGTYSLDGVQNFITAENVQGGSGFSIDFTSVGKYGVRARPTPVNLILEDSADLTDWATDEVDVLAEPSLKMDSITFTPETDPAVLWPEVLRRDLGDGITVEHHPAEGVGSRNSYSVDVEGSRIQITNSRASVTYILAPTEAP